MRIGLSSFPLLTLLPLALVLGCADSQGKVLASGSAGDDTGTSTGDAPLQIDVDPDPWLEQVYKPVMEEAQQMSVDDFLAAYPEPALLDGISYDPAGAVGLAEIAAYTGMTGAHDKLLAQNGFVAVAKPTTINFVTAYHDMYYNDLPVLITTDSVLFALHSSFDAILMKLELAVLAPKVEGMLGKMHARLGQDLAGLPTELQEAARDLDVYLTVARSLVGTEPVAALTGEASAQEVERILAAVTALQPLDIELFGVGVTYDFSQFKPRGHYTDDPILQRYFQAMMWLGRTEMRMITFDPDGAPRFNRRGVDAAFMSNLLLAQGGADGLWTEVDKVLERLIGERDNMNATDMIAFMAETGIQDHAALAAAEDDALFKALVASPYGIQRIMSQIMYTDPTDPPLVLPRVYLLLGQRFTIDSYVFHNVTYDRVQDLRTGAKVTRMLPSELDVGFVLGSNTAAHHLEPELQSYGYQGILHELRFLVDAHPADFWDLSFYNGWLSAIRSLGDDTDLDQRPEAMRTRAWADKTLNAQLASWAELRHDTLLYVKQSYSGGIGCEYPDAYVEPYPAFYERMAHVGQLGATMIDELLAAGYPMEDAKTYFQGMSATMAQLETIAHKELEGEVLTQAEHDFLRAAVEQEMVGCGEVLWDGWYSNLIFDKAKIEELSPVIADVHTAPTDAEGNPVGWVLHAAAGTPMDLVLTVQDCSGVRAYVGPSSSYHSVLTEDFARLADQEWRDQLDQGPQARPSWATFTP
ncbi:MAG TPA: DUF3160 domain-containing protein [Nannocystaceae bacterium]|nr:DUF3160 domain-containing protein [Nannocystaceae bacterium]